MRQAPHSLLTPWNIIAKTGSFGTPHADESRSLASPQRQKSVHRWQRKWLNCPSIHHYLRYLWSYILNSTPFRQDFKVLKDPRWYNISKYGQICATQGLVLKKISKKQIKNVSDFWLQWMTETTFGWLFWDVGYLEKNKEFQQIWDNHGFLMISLFLCEIIITSHLLVFPSYHIQSVWSNMGR